MTARDAAGDGSPDSLLFEPLPVAGHILQNRVVLTAHRFDVNAYSPAQDGGQYLGYLSRLVSGRVGLAMTQAIPVPPVGPRGEFPLRYLRDRLCRAADIIHATGAVALVQTIHKGITGSAGGDATVPWDGGPMWGFSAVRSDTGPEVGHAMTAVEIERLLEGWALTAELVLECGFDGLELHGGHGYLLHQSISPRTNQRTDDWGEPLAFWRALTGRLRAVLGLRAILSARFPTRELRPPEAGGLSDEHLRELAASLIDTGNIDLVNPSEGSSFLHYPRSVGSYRRPHGDFMDGVAALRERLAGAVPVLGVGRIVTTAEAEDHLRRGRCDLVGMTRAHIADPDVLPKVRTGRGDEVRHCVGANHCIDRISANTYAMCFHNPDVGREYRLRGPGPAPRKRVLVIGAGPAGLAAAVEARRCGHAVDIVERAERTGGRLAAITGVSPAVELVEAVDHLSREARRLGVRLRLGTTADAGLLADGGFDAIVLATGSRPAPPPFPTDDTVSCVASEDAVDAAAAFGVARVVVVDLLGNDEGAVVAEQLIGAGHEVLVATPQPVVGAYLGVTHAADHLTRLLAGGAAVRERTSVQSVRDGVATVTDAVTGRSDRVPCDLVVVVADRVAEDGLAEPARRRHSVEVSVVGDASAPRAAMTAFVEGTDAGRALGDARGFRAPSTTEEFIDA
ncbi:NADH:flavin oxidoreductase [Pseudonocardia halophobica]|uniref:N-methylproline demethylase n=1 Tax=Pseudonocardia halophobica TaxID=29401 RepID=A0A9W6L2C0_9PSEU|nr:FAD-dependent oxidoreductase [Pseudonocardia halophobica]GLL09759.1 N-methylproline demethylase [Pseudonocardia halophobica]